MCIRDSALLAPHERDQFSELTRRVKRQLQAMLGGGVRAAIEELVE